MVIAIDGPAGSGKSTTARLVARELGFQYLDTGAMYRAIALAFLREGIPFTEEAARAFVSKLSIDLVPSEEGLRVFLNGEDVTEEIRSPEVSRAASKVSALMAVREALVKIQRRIARKFEEEYGGVVVDGRDIGTVVFPDAEVKVFMVASPEVRARRRYEELRRQGKDVTYEEVLQEILERDRRDTERAISPLRKASDAVELDTTNMSIEEQVRFVLDLVKERQKGKNVTNRL